MTCVINKMQLIGKNKNITKYAFSLIKIKLRINILLKYAIKSRCVCTFHVLLIFRSAMILMLNKYTTK